MLAQRSEIAIAGQDRGRQVSHKKNPAISGARVGACVRTNAPAILQLPLSLQTSVLRIASKSNNKPFQTAKTLNTFRLLQHPSLTEETQTHKVRRVSGNSARQLLPYLTLTEETQSHEVRRISGSYVIQHTTEVSRRIFCDWQGGVLS
jgi:hypothetical protein